MIAIIIDSYERTNQRSREIFGRAQVEYAAALVARKQFIRVSVREMACVFCGMQENAILTCTYLVLSAKRSVRVSCCRVCSACTKEGER
jgi:hypothetical protein